MSWFRAFEPWLTEQLLRSPAFHRFVGRVHKTARQIQHGKDPEEMGGINIDRPPGSKSYLEHFKEELKGQLGSGRGPQDKSLSGPPGSKSYLDHFKEELRDQVRGEGKPPDKS